MLSQYYIDCKYHNPFYSCFAGLHGGWSGVGGWGVGVGAGGGGGLKTLRVSILPRLLILVYIKISLFFFISSLGEAKVVFIGLPLWVNRV